MPRERQGPGSELVEVAYARDSAEARMLQGLLESQSIPSILQALSVDGTQLGFATLAGSPQRVMAPANQAERARALLAETLVDPREDQPEPVNATYMEDAAGGRKPRGYGLVGAYARIYLWSFAGLAAAFGIFLLLRGS